MEGARILKPGELVKPDCGKGPRGSSQVPIWGHPLRRHWKDNAGWWLKDQSGVVIEFWETNCKHGDTIVKTGYKYKIMASNGVIGWVDDNDILLMEGER